MTKHVTQLGGLAAALLALASTASAEIKINDNFSVAGYIVGLADYAKIDGSDSASTMDLQATKLTATAKFSPVTGVLSYYAGADNDPVVLDAFATYDLGGGSTLTFGKFLSWLGYEAFDPINMATITYGWNTVPGSFSVIGIPAYHTGLKYEHSTDTGAFGVAIIDSNNYSTPFHKGDGDLDNGPGLEAYYNFKISPALNIFLGGAYDKDSDADVEIYSVDLWAQYVTGALTVAGEISLAKADAGTTDSDVIFWLLFAKFAASDKTAFVGRIAGAENDGGGTLAPSYLKFSFCPIFTITPNLEVVGELSYATYEDVGYDDATYAGVQARFKF